MKRKPARKLKKRVEPTQAIVKHQQQTQIVSIPEAIEKVLILGDLASLMPQDRVDYYKRVCNSLGLNPLTMPFSYILFKEFDGGAAKLSLYANKSCTEQLRKIHGVSVVPPMRRSRTVDIVMVECDVRDKTGRTDTASGSVPLYKVKDGRRIDFAGKDLCNAEMKCETKAKRRATLSICGLAILDESELDTMQVVGGVTPDGRIYEFREQQQRPQLTEGDEQAIESLKAKGLWCEEHQTTRSAKHIEICESSRKATEKLSQAAPVAESQPKEKPATRKPDPKASEGAKDVPKSAPLPAMPEREVKYHIEIDWTQPHSPILRGQIGDLLPSFQKFLHMTWKDDWWHITPDDAALLLREAGQYGIHITEIQPGQVSSAAQSPKSAPAAQGKAKATGGGVTAASPASSPETVVGTIERVQPSSDGKRAVVTLVKNTGGKGGYTCFDKDIYGILTAKLGQLAEVILQTREKDGKTYVNLVGLKRVGSTEYEDGKVPVIQNKDREAGGRTLFP